MYIQQLREMIPPSSQNTVGVCNQITLLIPYCTGFRLATLLKVNDATIKVSDIRVLTVSFKFLNFSFQIFLLFVLECLLVSCLTLFILSTLLWFGSCSHCLTPSFLWSKYYEHFTSNYCLCCFCSYSFRLSVAKILFSWGSDILFIFSQGLLCPRYLLSSPKLQTCLRS